MQKYRIKEKRQKIDFCQQNSVKQHYLQAFLQFQLFLMILFIDISYFLIFKILHLNSQSVKTFQKQIIMQSKMQYFHFNCSHKYSTGTSNFQDFLYTQFMTLYLQIKMGQELKALKKKNPADSDLKAIFNQEKYLQKLALSIQKEIKEGSADIAKEKKTMHETIIEITPSNTDDFQWENQNETLKKIREYVNPDYVETVKTLIEEQTRLHLLTKNPTLAQWSSKFFMGVKEGTIVYLRYFVLVSQVQKVSLELNQLILYGYAVTILEDNDIGIDQRITIKEAAKHMRQRQTKKYGLDEKEIPVPKSKEMETKL